MPSLKDIIAAKQAKAAATPPPRTRAQIAEDIEMEAVIDRIDPPGKKEAAASARKTAALILNRDMPVPAKVQQAPADLPRSLAQSEGEAMDMTPVGATPTEQAWHKAAQSLSTDLCIVRDWKDPERAWLAVRLPECPDYPILIKDLPLFDHPRTARQPNEPF